RTVGADFFGVFSASDDPQPANFPSGVFFQRYVLAGGSVQTNSWLASSGNLVNYNASGGRYNVSPSIDPFMFYDIAPVFRGYTFVLVRYPFFYDPVDPLSPITRMVWPELGAGLPQFKLYTSPTLDAGGSWAPAANTPVTEASGQFEAPLSGSASQAFFRVQQDVSNAQFELFASAGSHGAVEPQGVLAVPGMGTMTFSAAADPGYGVGSWYVDGTLAQSGGAAFTLSNIINEHTLVAAFVASNDLAVTIGDVPAISDPTVTGGTNDYIINIQNQGLSSLTGIVMTNPLPATIAVLSAATSQGTVTNAGGVVSASVGSLDPGASATVDITFTPAVSGAITDTVTVACDQTEADLSNNIATDVTTVLDPVTITNQPASTNVPPGEMASFSVGVSGTPPFQYQWFFNRTNAIADGTNSTLTLTNVTATDAGMYSVFVFQAPGPEDIVEADSNPASLTVGVVGAPAVVSPNNRTSLKLIR
ncbi:MAG: immunoglobulin domain-containing protein, partial [Verrucomicrobia bacterium]|nr:immunoglobulin domain-containing protein [Verrucomicrobiota bacterium]